MIGWLKDQVWPLIEGTINEWNEDGGSTIAAAMAYYAAFSFFPLVLVLLAILGYMLRFSPEALDIRQQLLDLIALNTSETLARQISDMLDGVRENAGVSGPLGLAGLLIGAMGVFAQLDNAFDHIWDIPSPESAGIIDSIQRILHGRFKAFLMMLGLGLLILVAFIAGMVLSAIQQYTTNLPGGRIGWKIFQILVSIGVYTLVFMLIYTILPRVRIHWRDALPGALLAAIIWEIGRQILAAFVVGTRYRTAYGVVGSFIALMVWIYYASTVLFLGAEFVQVLSRHKEQRRQVELEREHKAEILPAAGLAQTHAASSPSTKAKAAYATGGVLIGVVGALMILPAGLLMALLRLIRRR